MILSYHNNVKVKVEVGVGVINTLDNYINKDKKYLVITDKNVDKLYHYYLDKFINFDIYVIEPGEISKSYAQAQEIIAYMFLNGYTKSDEIIAFGGGVIGDLAGYIASIYKRGLAYINIPTSLIAQVDSSIGGKVGINYQNYKNQIGSIYHPHLVLTDPLFLKTLSSEDLTAGMVEVIKYGVICDKKLFYSIMNEKYDLTEVIKKSISIKSKITRKDPFDKGLRNLLNLGHTIGHAIEAEYHLKHGIAVGYGMYLETKNEEIKALLLKMGFDFTKEFKELDKYIKYDKKIRDGKILFVDVKRIGRAYLKEANIDEYIQRIS